MAGDYVRNIRVFIAQHLNPEASALAFAKEVRGQVIDMQRANELPARYRRFVDGREGAEFETVKPGGSIALEASYNSEILAFALAFLFQRSPTGPMPTSGHRLYTRPFRESFWVSFDGNYIRPGMLNLNNVPAGPMEILIGNLQPYARKLDAQRIGKRTLHFNKPEGLYADAAKAVNDSFGNVVQAKRVYDINFPDKYKLKQTQMRTGARAHNVKRWAGAYVESPALLIKPR